MKLLSIGLLFSALNITFSLNAASCQLSKTTRVSFPHLLSDNESGVHLPQILDFIFFEEANSLVVNRFSDEELYLLKNFKHQRNLLNCNIKEKTTTINTRGTIGISGYVREEGSNAIITDGYIHVYGSTGNFLGLTPIDSQGNYSYTGLANGTYYVRTDNTGYFDELWNNIPCAQGNCIETNGTPISINGSNQTANFNLVLGGSISGYVREEGSNAIITDGYIHVYGSTGSFLGLTPIDSQGNYSYTGLDNGTYYVRTDNTGYFDELWDDLPCADGNCNETNGTPLIIQGNDLTANFLLSNGGAISGYVREEGSNAIITDGYIYVYSSTGSFLGLTPIDSQGNYSYTGLANGTYYVRTDNTGYFDELWNNIPCAQGNCIETNGTPISINGSNQTANFDLAHGGSISGYVREHGTNSAITDGYIHIYNAQGQFLGLTLINNQGNYSYSGLENGIYYVRTDNTGYVDELWNNIPCSQGVCDETNGTPIAISGGVFTANFILGNSFVDEIFSDGFE